MLLNEDTTKIKKRQQVDLKIEGERINKNTDKF